MNSNIPMDLSVKYYIFHDKSTKTIYCNNRKGVMVKTPHVLSLLNCVNMSDGKVAPVPL